MILKFTSLNSNLRMNASPPNRTSSRLRWMAGIPLLLCFLFFNSNESLAQAPVFTTPAVCPGTATVMLPVGGGTITFTDANIPGFLSVDASDPGGGTVTYSTDVASVDCSNEGMVVAITVTATNDAAPNETETCLINATVSSSGGMPTASCMAITATLDAAGSATVNPADIDNGSFSCSGITMMMVDDGSGAAPSKTYMCADVGPQTLTLVVTDAFGTSTCDATITVVDDTPPTFTCPAGQTVALNAACEMVIPDLLTGITDEMDACGMVTLAQSQTSGATVASMDGGTTMVTITATDVNMNSSTCAVTLTGDDTTPPTATCQAFNAVLDATTGSYTLAAADINDGSTDNCGTANLSIAATTFTCADVATNPNMVTLNVDDGNGNMSSCMAAVTVVDSSPPMAYPDLPVTGQINNSPGDCFATVQWPNTLMDNCGGATAVTIVSAIDYKGNDFPVISAGGNFTGDFPVDTTVVTYTATDVSGNSINSSFIVVVTDSEAPLVNCPPSPYLQPITSCNAADQIVPNLIGLATISDNCSPNLTVVQIPAAGVNLDDPIDGPGLTPADGESYTVTIEVYDTDNVSTCSFTINLIEDDAPTPDVSGLVLEPDSSDCGSLIIQAPTATDACDNPVCGTPFPVDPAIWNQVPGTGPCPGATVVTTLIGGGNPQTINDLSCGNPTLTATSVAASTLTGIIGSGPSEFEISNVTVDLDHTWNTDIEISLISPAGTSIDLSSDNGGTGDNYTMTVFDDNALTDITAGFSPFTGSFRPEQPMNATLAGETVNGDWTLSVCDDEFILDGTLNSFSITFTNTPGGSVPQYEFEPGNHTITWIYDDGNGNTSSQLQQIVVTEDTELPTIACDPITVILDDNGDASIDDFGNSIINSLSLGDEDETAQIPIGFTFPFYNTSFTDLVISSNGIIGFGTTILGSNFHLDFARADLDPSAGGTINYYTTGTSPNQTFVLNFNNVPHWNSSATTTIQAVLHEDGLIEIFGTDLQAGNPMTQGLGSTGINLLNVIVAGRLNAVFSATNDVVTFIPNGTGGYTIDQTGAFAPAATPFAIEDFVTADDNCGLDMSSFSADITSFDCSDVGTVDVTITVTDINGNPNSCISTVTVIDNLMPEILNVPGPSTTAFECSNIPDTTGYNVYAIDNCGILGITYNESTTQIGNAANCGFYDYSLTRIWTATDDSGNTSSASETILIEDTEGPEFSLSLPSQITANADLLNCSATVNLFVTSTDYSDACAANNVLTLTNTGAPLGAGNGSNDASGTYPIGSTFVTFTATDPCGNSGQYTVEVIVTDGIAPVALCSATTISIPSGSNSVTILPIYINNGSIDNCAGLLDPNDPAQMTVSPSSFDCTQLGTQTVTLTVSDGTLTGSCATTVTVQDLTPPDAVCAAPFDVNVDASGSASITVADIDAGSSDACSGLLSTGIDVTSFDFMDIDSTIDVTLTVTDSSMNVSTCVTQVTVLGPTTCFDVGSAVGGAGNVIEIPVTVTDFTSVNSFQFSLNITGDDTMIDLGEFEEMLTNVHPDLDTPGSILFPSIQYDSLPTNDTLVQVQYGDILDGNGDPYDGLLDTVDVAAVLDTILFANTLSISYLGDASLPGVTLTDGTVVFTLNVLLTGNIGQSTTILNIPNTNNTPPEILYDFGMGNLIVGTPCFIPGGFLINELIISGAIYTEPAAICNAPAPNVPAASPVGLVDVELYEIFGAPLPASLEDTYTTGSDGLFEFTINGAGDYELRPEKDINWGNQLGTITSFDVQRIQAHAVGATPLCTAYKKIAADVNDNGQITTVDAALLNFFVINNVPPLPTPNDPPNKSWRFVDAKQVLTNSFDANVPAFNEVIAFDNLISDTTDNDFIGVKIGDIDNNIDPLQFTTGGGDPELQGEGRTGSLEFVIADATTKADESLAVDFTAKSFDNMVAYQWILKFDEKALAFDGMTAKALQNLSDNNVGVQALDYGMISFTWYSVDAVSHTEDDVLFTLNFTGLKDDVKLSDIFEVQEFNVFPTEAYTNNAEIRDIELGFSNNKESVAFELFQNQPNPFKDETNISFSLPTATTATLTISDATGRTLKVIEGDYDKGYNEISVNRNTLPASGVLYYQLETSEFSATKKMIIVE